MFTEVSTFVLFIFPYLANTLYFLSLKIFIYSFKGVNVNVTPVTSLVLHILYHLLTKCYESNLKLILTNFSTLLTMLSKGPLSFKKVIFLKCKETFITKTSLVLHRRVDMQDTVKPLYNALLYNANPA